MSDSGLKYWLSISGKDVVCSTPDSCENTQEIFSKHHLFKTTLHDISSRIQIV